MLPITIDPAAYPAAVILALFFVLAISGMLLLSLIQMETALEDNRERWLSNLRHQARTLRLLRRQVEKTGGNLPDAPLPPGIRRNWRLLRWAASALVWAKAARS